MGAIFFFFCLVKERDFEGIFDNLLRFQLVGKHGIFFIFENERTRTKGGGVAV